MKARLRSRSPFALLPLVLSAGCATVWGSRQPSLSVAANADSATISDARGAVLGVTPLRRPLRLPARGDTLAVSHPGRGTERIPIARRMNPVTHLNLVYGAGFAFFGLLGEHRELAGAGVAAAVLGWVVDRVSGRAWLLAPDAVYATLPPPRDPPPLARDATPAAAEGAAAQEISATLADTAVVVETLRRLAAVAYEAGCDSTFPRFWLNERGNLAGEATRALTDAELAAIQRSVGAATERLRAACVRANPRAAADRQAIEHPLPPVATDLSAPVYFAYNSAAVPDSVIPRMRELARRLRNSGGGVTLMAEGFADPAGAAGYNEALGLARARAVVAVLRAAGPLPAGCCEVRSYGARPAWLAAPGHGGRAPLSRFNRRVDFHLAPVEAER